MMQNSLNVYFKILKSVKTYVYIITSLVLSSSYFIIEYISNRDINKLDIGNDILLFRDYKIISIFGNSTYFITLGFLLWLIILLEIMKYFRTYNDQGILLTHISRSYTRQSYFFSIIIGIYLAFITVVSLNLLLSFVACIIVFKFFSIALFKMFLVSLIYAVIHIAIIIIVLSFLAVIFKQTEMSIMASVFVIIFTSLSIFLKGSIEDMGFDPGVTFNTLVVLVHADSYFYLSLTRNIFLIFNEKLAASTFTTIDFFKIFKILSIDSIDPDLNFILFSNIKNVQLIERLILTLTVLVNSLLFYVTVFIFKRMDIAGN